IHQRPYRLPSQHQQPERDSSGRLCMQHRGTRPSLRLPPSLSLRYRRRRRRLTEVQFFGGGYITQNGQIFSPHGVCSPFDANADGTVPADAVAAIVLKRHSVAQADVTLVYTKIVATG